MSVWEQMPGVAGIVAVVGILAWLIDRLNRRD